MDDLKHNTDTVPSTSKKDLTSRLGNLTDESGIKVALLPLVSKGSAIIAELLRLSDYVPGVFTGKDQRAWNKYEEILFDFKYFGSTEGYDEKIDSSERLQDLDEQFRETHFNILKRFFSLFESIYLYINDVKNLFKNLKEGLYIETLEGFIDDIMGKQLMCESLYLYGVMLLLLDIRIPGQARELMIVAFYRLAGPASVENINSVRKLCRSTGFSVGSKKKTKDYPEEYFSRITLPDNIISLILGRLRTDDIYQNIKSYPNPDHRSSALSMQATMLYVCLYFKPELLHKEVTVMREIVDKYFYDNWVIPIYMGFTIDLSQVWYNYSAAQKALTNILTKENIKLFTKKKSDSLLALHKELNKYLTKGVMKEDYVLIHVRKLIACAREYNIVLRWFLLHMTTNHKKFLPIVTSVPSLGHHILNLLLKGARFENRLKEILIDLLTSKTAKWDHNKKEAVTRMNALSEYFSGKKQLLNDAKKDEDLEAWFKKFSAEIQSMEYDKSSFYSGHKMMVMIKELERVKQFDQVEDSLQVRQFLDETRGFLKIMIRIASIKPKFLSDLEIVSDFSYAWNIIRYYVKPLHKRIRQDPAICLSLRDTFSKLSSILQIPLIRISQIGSQDEISVAEYYTSRLVQFVRGVLEIIPVSVFQKLDQIDNVKTHKLKPMDSKFERIKLKDLAQQDLRYQLAEATHEVSVFTSGILGMKTTLVGIQQLDPKKVLEDGIRKQLVYKVCSFMNSFLIFKTGTIADFENRITQLGTSLLGLKNSMEYIQDYINMYGLKIWQEEFSRIINYSVEQESNQFIKKKVLDFQSKYQNEAIRIPQLPLQVNVSKRKEAKKNFMGRLLEEILYLTNTSSAVFTKKLQGWWSASKKKEIFGIRTVTILRKGIGIIGICGLDKLISFMIVEQLQKFTRIYRKQIDRSTERFVNQLETQLDPTSHYPSNAAKLYPTCIKKLERLWPGFLKYVTKIGQLQLIKMLLGNELNFNCRLDSKFLYGALDNVNKAVLNDIKAHYNDPEHKSYPDTKVIEQLTSYFDASGLDDPITKIYITTPPLKSLPCLMFLFVISQLHRLDWHKNYSTLASIKAGTDIDGAPLIIGVITILKQFHSSNTKKFVEYLGQYIRANLAVVCATPPLPLELPPQITKTLIILKEFCKFSRISKKYLNQVVPSYIFDSFFEG